MKTTKDVLEHHLFCNQRCDLDGVMEDYTEDSVLITPNAIYVGLQELRAFFTESMRTFPPGSIWHSDCISVYGESALTVYRAQSSEMQLLFGTDTYQIRNGKIIMQSFAGLTRTPF